MYVCYIHRLVLLQILAKSSLLHKNCLRLVKMMTLWLQHVLPAQNICLEDSLVPLLMLIGQCTGRIYTIRAVYKCFHNITMMLVGSLLYRGYNSLCRKFRTPLTFEISRPEMVSLAESLSILPLKDMHTFHCT